MPFLIIDSYSGNDETIVDSIDDVLQHFQFEEVQDRSYPGDRPSVYEIVREVKIETNPATFRVVNDSPATDIPAPLPGETVSDYARRISGG